MRILITGNIGCGKSTAIDMLRSYTPHSYEFFDFDQTVADLYQNSAIKMMLNLMFGTVDKAAISDLVHADPSKMKQLRNLMDQAIAEKYEAAIKHEDIILDVPLYFEHIEPNMLRRYVPDTVVCIVAPRATQIDRVIKRNGWSLEKITAVMDKQMDPVLKMEKSNHIIYNTGSLDHLQREVLHFARVCRFLD